MEYLYSVGNIPYGISLFYFGIISHNSINCATFLTTERIACWIGEKQQKRDFHIGSPLKIGGYSLLNALKLFHLEYQYSVWNILFERLFHFEIFYASYA